MTMAVASWDEARAVATAIGAERLFRAVSVPLVDAHGLVSAAAVRSSASLPGFDSSAMDGWAVAGDGPWALGAGIRMGAAPELREQEWGTARAITTGAAVPRGATAVLRSEGGEVRGAGASLQAGSRHDLLHVNARALAAGEPRPGQHIRFAGEEIAAGEQLWPAGTRVTPPRIGLAAAAGIDEVSVRRRPRIALLVTGDELVQSGVAAPGQVRDVFAPMVPGVLGMLGAELVSVERVADTRDAVTSALSAHATSDTGRHGADLVLTTGGSSHGAGDWVQRGVLDTAGVVLCAGVRMRPGHPVMLATLGGGRPVLALPGNPLAAVACLLSFLPPLLAALTGAVDRPLETVSSVQLSSLDVVAHERDTMLVPFRWSAGNMLASRWRGAAMLRGIADADGLVVLDPLGAGARLLDLPWAG